MLKIVMLERKFKNYRLNMAGIMQSKQICLIFIVVPQSRKNLRLDQKGRVCNIKKETVVVFTIIKVVIIIVIIIIMIMIIIIIIIIIITIILILMINNYKY